MENNQNFEQGQYQVPPVYNPSPSFSTFQGEFNKVTAVLKKHSIVVGICLLCFLIVPYILMQLIAFLGFGDLYNNDEVFATSVEIFIIVLCVFVPFLISLLWVRKYHDIGSLGYEKPKSKKVFWFAIPAGLMLCCVGDYLSSIIVTILSSVGIELSAVDQTIPTAGVALVAYAFQVIVVPAIIEEFAMRGVALQPLRKYGERFAILSTAIIFGLMHRNIIQGIFAFFAGLVLGYVAVVTESVWTAVIVHGLNNAFSVVTQVLSQTMPDSYEKIYMATSLVIFVVGVVCLVALLSCKDRHKLTNNVRFMTDGYKLKKTILTVPMVIAFIMMIIETMSYVSLA